MLALSLRGTVPVLSLYAFKAWGWINLPVFLNQLKSVVLAASWNLLCRKTKDNQSEVNGKCLHL
jgi:hypothetical protein